MNSEAFENLQLTRVESVSDVENLMRWVGERRPTKLSVDVETTGLNAGSDRIRTAQFGDGQQGWFLDHRDWRGVTKQIIETYDRPMVAHNLQFDSKMLKVDGIEIPQRLAHDTMVLCHLKDAARGIDLKGSAARYVDKRAKIGQNLLKEAYSKGGWDWATIPTDVPAYWIYSTMDTCLCSLLDYALYDEIIASYREAYELELAAIHCLRDAEIAGMHVDEEYRQLAEQKLLMEIALLEPQLPIDNPGSDKQVIDYLHSLGARWEVYTEKGNLSVDKHVLEWLAPKFPICTVLAEWRTKTRLLTNYIQKMAENPYGLAANGVLHANTRSVEARTGRMSVTNPPMQTLPRGRVVRDAIVAKPGHVFVMADFAGMEMRALASFAQEQRMLAMFNSGLDVHTETAKQLYGNDFTKPQRTVCKNGGFAKVYGAGVAKFAVTAGIEMDVATAFVENYDLLFPGINHYMEKTMQEVVTRAGGRRGYGYVETIDGRRLPVEGDKAYKGVNFTIQGSCAVTTKKKIVELAQAGLGDWFRLAVHDELIYEVPFEHVEVANKIIQHVMPERRDYPGVVLEIESDMVDRWGQHYREDYPAYIETEDPEWWTRRSSEPSSFFAFNQETSS